MSIGAILVSKIIQDISKILDSDFDIDILDIHHNHKKDRPSGTSLMYAKILADITNKKIITNNIGIREKNTIECLSIRSGMAYGSHTITFTGNDEVISVNHQALNRTIFAKGALKAALWLSNKSKGLYSMMDMLEY